MLNDIILSMDLQNHPAIRNKYQTNMVTVKNRHRRHQQISSPQEKTGVENNEPEFTSNQT